MIGNSLRGSKRHHSIILYYLSVLCFAFAGLAAAMARAAEPLPAPFSKVILSIEGKVLVANSQHGAEFDKAMLEAMPQQTVRTETPWTDGVTVFEGPLLSTVLERVGAQGEVLEAAALNDYKVEIPVADARRYPVIVALKMNGAALQVRTRGPLWVVYPWSQHAELQTETVYSRSIWQLSRILVR
ncbi:MAG: molybdopterin-dependent oxidoreductase [Gammaproteobacteria bacterium]